MRSLCTRAWGGCCPPGVENCSCFDGVHDRVVNSMHDRIVDDMHDQGANNMHDHIVDGVSHQVV